MTGQILGSGVSGKEGSRSTQFQIAPGQSFFAHLAELRRRIFWSVVSLVAGGAVGYFLHDIILALIIAPLDQPLYYTSPTGGFDFMLKVCLFFGFIVSVPVFTYNLLKFLEPTMPKKSKNLIAKLLVVSTLLSACGVGFAYLVSLPAALHFLMEFGSDRVQALISTSEYFSFAMVYLAGFAVLFQLPLILLFINRITPLPPRKLMKQQRLVVLASFIAAALITPTPDPLNQTLMAVPIVVLYQISVLLIWFKNRGEKFQEVKPLGLTVAAKAQTARRISGGMERSITTRSAYRKPSAPALPVSNLMPVMRRPVPVALQARAAVAKPNIHPLATPPPKRPDSKLPLTKPNFPKRSPLVDLTKARSKPFNAVPKYNVLNLKQQNSH